MRKLPVLFLIMIPIIMSCETQVNVNPSPEPTAISGTSTPVITSTPEQTPVPTVTPSPAESVTPIIESNMEEIISESHKPTLPPVEKLPEYYKSYGFLQGSIYDENKKSIPDASVTLEKYSLLYKDHNFYEKYDYHNSTKTDSSGYYEFLGPNGFWVIINVQKEGYTKTSVHESFQDAGRQLIDIDFTLYKKPEIQEIKINGSTVTGYDPTKVKNYISDLETLNGDFTKRLKLKYDMEIPRFKISNTNYLKIELTFNQTIDKKSLEENIFIESLNKSVSYNSKTNGATFQWSDNNKKIIFHVPIATKSEDIIYSLGFKEPFTDNEGNKPLEGSYFNTGIRNTQLSENIIFAIAGGQ